VKVASLASARPAGPKRCRWQEAGIETNWIISFGPFRVTRARRLMERNGEVVRLGSRAFDVLAYLLEHAGQVVSHRALLEAVWPGTYVGEGNLRFQMATLRKVLGKGDASYIINVPGRGYCFTAPISKQDEIKYSPRLLNNAVVEPGSGNTPLANTPAANILPYPASRPVMGKVRDTMSVVFPGKGGKSVAEIRAKLDDLALSIQLAASQVNMLGIHKVSDLLEKQWFSSWPGDGETPAEASNALRHAGLELPSPVGESKAGVSVHIRFFPANSIWRGQPLWLTGMWRLDRSLPSLRQDHCSRSANRGWEYDIAFSTRPGGSQETCWLKRTVCARLDVGTLLFSRKRFKISRAAIWTRAYQSCSSMKWTTCWMA